MTPREEFIIRIAREAPDLPVSSIGAILRNAKTHQRIEIARSERPLSEAEKARTDRAVDNVVGLLWGHPVTVHETHGDPRGFCLKLKLPSGASNNLGGEAWGVPA